MSDYGTVSKADLAKHVEPLGGSDGYAKVGFRNRDESDAALVKIPQRPLNGVRLQARMLPHDNPWMTDQPQQQQQGVVSRQPPPRREAADELVLKCTRGDAQQGGVFLTRKILTEFNVDTSRFDVANSLLTFKMTGQVSPAVLKQKIAACNQAHPNFQFEVVSCGASRRDRSAPNVKRNPTVTQPLLPTPYLPATFSHPGLLPNFPAVPIPRPAVSTGRTGEGQVLHITAPSSSEGSHNLLFSLLSKLMDVGLEFSLESSKHRLR